MKVGEGRRGARAGAGRKEGDRMEQVLAKGAKGAKEGPKGPKTSILTRILSAHTIILGGSQNSGG